MRAYRLAHRVASRNCGVQLGQLLAYEWALFSDEEDGEQVLFTSDSEDGEQVIFTINEEDR